MGKISIGSVSSMKRECMPLLNAYWDEVDERRDTHNVCINFDSYAQLERADMLKIFVYKEEGEVIGFVVYTVAPCTHTRVLKATTEITYILPEYRGCGIVDELYLTAERYFKATGTSQIFITLKTEFSHDSLVERAGFRHVENVYMKEI